MATVSSNAWQTEYSGATVVLIGCSREKRATPTMARYLYQSERFQLAVKWAESRHLPWLILSGRHGLILPEDTIEYYDFDLGSTSPEIIGLWADSVVAALREQIPDLGTIVILACDDYAFPVADRLENIDVRCILPIVGLGPEERTHRIRKMLNDESELLNIC